MYIHHLRKAPNEKFIILQFHNNSSLVYLSVTVLNGIEMNIIRILTQFLLLLLLLVNVCSDK
jgi:hypothetical protein